MAVIYILLMHGDFQIEDLLVIYSPVLCLILSVLLAPSESDKYIKILFNTG